jgi:hypothetical protein
MGETCSLNCSGESVQKTVDRYTYDPGGLKLYYNVTLIAGEEPESFRKFGLNLS